MAALFLFWISFYWLLRLLFYFIFFLALGAGDANWSKSYLGSFMHSSKLAGLHSGVTPLGCIPWRDKDICLVRLVWHVTETAWKGEKAKGFGGRGGGPTIPLPSHLKASSIQADYRSFFIQQVLFMLCSTPEHDFRGHVYSSWLCMKFEPHSCG